MGAMNVKAHEAKKMNKMIKCFEWYAEHGSGRVDPTDCEVSGGVLFGTGLGAVSDQVQKKTNLV